MNRVPMEGKVLNENSRVAAELRERFREHRVLAVNLISSPGSGKTTLLEKTLEAFPAGGRVAVLTGDLQTENDANRLKRYGYPVKQITTGGTCHLDARMIEKHILTGTWTISTFSSSKMSATSSVPPATISERPRRSSSSASPKAKISR